MEDESGLTQAARQEHDILVELIARRIGIATWNVAANLASGPRTPVPCPIAPSGQAYPDIVAREKFTNRLAAVGEVETAATLGESQAAVWATSAQLAPRFFLYVPEELEPAARSLLAARRIRPAGLFLYRYTERNMFVVRRAR
jgi:hypothetical protein